MNITEQELQMLEDCQSKQEWSEACIAVKDARDGQYPDDWWDKVKESGMMDRIMARWDETSELKISTHNNKTDALKYLFDNDEDYGHFGKHLFNKRNKTD